MTLEKLKNWFVEENMGDFVKKSRNNKDTVINVILTPKDREELNDDLQNTFKSFTVELCDKEIENSISDSGYNFKSVCLPGFGIFNIADGEVNSMSVKWPK